MKRIATIESGFARDTQIFAGDPSITETDPDWASNSDHEFLDVKYACHYIGIFEGGDENEIRSKAAAAQGVYPDVITLTEVEPESEGVKNVTPEVGMTVYLRPTIYNRDKKIIEGTLSAIGRKYYTVAACHHVYKFDIENREDVSEYSPSYYLHFSREDVDNEIEREHLIKGMSNYFQTATVHNCSLTREQLHKIAALIGGV